MNSLDRLSTYLRQLESRFQLATVASGIATAAIVALVSTVVVVLLSNYLAFSDPSLTGGRIFLFLCVTFAIAFGLIVPLLQLNRKKAARKIERDFPQFQERLLTFAEKESEQGKDPFIELLAADTIEAAEQVEPRRIVTDRRILSLASVAGVSLGVLAWLIISGPGFFGYGSALLWAGTASRGETQRFYDIVVQPGNHSVRRGGSQAINARLIGFQSPTVRVFARYRSTTKWEEALMLPQEGGSAYEFLFAGVPETVDYYVTAGRVRSKTYTLSVIDLPAVRRIRVTYRYPSWTGLKTTVEDPGGDLRAVEGTEAEVAVQTDRALNSGTLVVDGGTDVPLNSSGEKWAAGRLKIQKDGVYYVAARIEGELVRLSDDYFIEAHKNQAPLLRIVRPGRDAKVSPIEEVTFGVQGEDDFGLQEMTLHYSVNGGEEKTAALLKEEGQKNASGTTLLCLEDFGLVPGDIVAYYATARDAQTTARTDLYFLEAQPFDRQFYQSQQMGSGGGVGQQQSQISQRQKEIIAATWNQLRDKTQGKQAAAENAKLLAGIQGTLRDQAQSLARRMRRRELSGTNEEFQSFSRDMEQAAEAMGSAVDKLKAIQWREALTPEQKALQHLLRAESTFRKIQVAFGSRGGGGGGGGMGRDLESLFDLELDTEKNQYETGQQAASMTQRNREVDEALQRLEQLARRQQELAERQRQGQLSSQQRWQQEMLRREAEELQHRIQDLMRGNSQSTAQGQQGQQSGSSASARGMQGRLSSMGRQSQTDPRLERALRRLEQATEDMRRAGSPQSGQSQAQSRRAAERLQEARDLVRGLRRQEASEQLNDIVRQAEQLSQQQQDFANRVRENFGAEANSGEGSIFRRRLTREQAEQSGQLAEEKAQMTEKLAQLERDMKQAARELAGSQSSASSKVREALGEMQKQELSLRMRYNTELLRRGLGQYVWMREAPITMGIQNMRDQLREARAALGSNPSGENQTERMLARVEGLRRQLQRMTQGANRGQQGQRGENPSGRGARAMAGDSSGATGDSENRQGAIGGAGPMRDFSAMNRGDRQPPTGGIQPRAGDPAEVRRLYQQSLGDLSQLRRSMQDDPDAARDIQALIREMQQLDPSRFPGNPELIERVRAQVLPGLEQVELQLRRKLDEKEGGQVRSGASEPVPAGYADAVAEYFRELSKQH